MIDHSNHNPKIKIIIRIKIKYVYVSCCYCLTLSQLYHRLISTIYKRILLRPNLDDNVKQKTCVQSHICPLEQYNFHFWHFLLSSILICRDIQVLRFLITHPMQDHIYTKNINYQFLTCIIFTVIFHTPISRISKI